MAAPPLDPEKRRSPLAAGSVQYGDSGNGIVTQRPTDTQGEAPGDAQAGKWLAMMLFNCGARRFSDTKEDFRRHLGWRAA